ncbi:MAG: aminotransferase class V-fold PLP-dependent enzyme [Desulfovibrio sp.]|jgi:aspartate aminotransferase-like enzyme|nr:aminotransferase class V-fold PLP-dependent enzyme [Desulfovibrio sp.]
MSTNDFASLKLFITGPTMLRPEVRQAGTLPEFGHRDLENDKRLQPAMHWLAELADAGDEYTPVLFLGSGSTGMEASIRSLVAGDETVLNVSVGAFGDLFHNMAVANEKRAKQLKFECGRAVDLDSLEQALKEHRPGVVTFTHNETSTGVINDIHAISELVRRYGAMPVVDGVSIFGGTALGLKGSGIAMYCSATQKSLGLPAGFGIGFVHAEAEEKARRVKGKGHGTDILKHLERARRFQTLSTPNTTLANQLYVQLKYIFEEEGVQNRFARHLAMRGMAEEWVAGLEGYELFAQEGHRSPALTTVRVPKGVTVQRLKDVKEAMRARGYLFDPGYGKLNTQLEQAGQRPIFRIGHMGDIMPDMLQAFLKDLGEVLGNL